MLNTTTRRVMEMLPRRALVPTRLPHNAPLPPPSMSPEPAPAPAQTPVPLLELMALHQIL